LLRIYNPNGSESFTCYPRLDFFWSQNAMTQQLLPRGSNYLGGIVQPPVDTQFRAIAQVIIPQYRRDLANAKVIESKHLPKLAQAVVAWYGQLPGTQITALAGRIRFDVSKNGVPAHEDVYAVLCFRVSPQMQSMFWSVEHICSIRGPAGKLDE